MNVAAPNLCKELHELSGWADCLYVFDKDEHEIIVTAGATALTVESLGYIPAYDLGYLLRKLPSGSGIVKNSSYPTQTYTARRPTMLGIPENPDPLKGRIGWDADTPENALCMMTIELFKQKVLKKNDDDENR